MSNVLRSDAMRHCLPCIALVAAMGHMGVQAADRGEPQPPPYRERLLPWSPHGPKPLRFRAPPSQMLEPWRCGGGGPCPYPRLAPDDVLDYPFVTWRLMPPLRPAPPPPSPSPSPSPGEPAAGTPPPPQQQPLPTE